MILHCSYEELRALSSGAELVLATGSWEAGGTVAAPPVVPATAAAAIELLLPRLVGDLGISTLAEQRRIREAVAWLATELRARMEREILEPHPGHEAAVLLYFDFAHVLKVLDRLDRMGAAMEAMIEVVFGGSATLEAAGSFSFPD
jgi:hypothetical protein